MAQPTQFPLYGRRWKLTINTFRGTAIILQSADVGKDATELRMTFEVDMRISRGMQEAVFTIYNLSANTETDILQNGASLTLEAGYSNGAYGVIFSGPIRQPLRGKEDGVTYYLKLICMDGWAELYTGLCNFVLAAGMTRQKIAQEIARSSSVPFDIKVDDLGNLTTQRGKVMFGQPGVLLRKIAQDANAALYVNQGIGYISKLAKGPPASVPLLNYKTGLIGMPQQTEDGVSARCLMNPNIRLDSFVKLNNKDIIIAENEFGTPQTTLDQDGIYRVVAITCMGDTRGNDWCEDLELIRQSGALPDMMSDQQQYGM